MPKKSPCVCGRCTEAEIAAVLHSVRDRCQQREVDFRFIDDNGSGCRVATLEQRGYSAAASVVVNETKIHFALLAAVAYTVQHGSNFCFCASSTDARRLFRHQASPPHPSS